MTAVLEAPAAAATAKGAAIESNSKSSNVTPVVNPLIWSANPAAVGASFVFVLALYAHVVQSKPPYTFTPSREAPTTSCSPVNVPHAYTRLPPLSAVSIACPIVPNGCSFEPSAGDESLPVGDTKIPNPSATTHGSVDGSSPAVNVQSVLQATPDG
jgi:hypothetical protein